VLGVARGVVLSANQREDVRALYFRKNFAGHEMPKQKELRTRDHEKVCYESPNIRQRCTLPSNDSSGRPTINTLSHIRSIQYVIADAKPLCYSVTLYGIVMIY
jgi:hypothetical protein